jgi:hypothetical protein
MAISRSLENGFMLYTVSGAVHVEDIVHSAIASMESDSFKNSLWDFTHATDENLRTESVEKLAHDLAAHFVDKRSGRVGLVGFRNFNLGLGILFRAFGAMIGLPFELKIFRNRTRAIEWLTTDCYETTSPSE